VASSVLRAQSQYPIAAWQDHQEQQSASGGLGQRGEAGTEDRGEQVVPEEGRDIARRRGDSARGRGDNSREEPTTNLGWALADSLSLALRLSEDPKSRPLMRQVAPRSWRDSSMSWTLRQDQPRRHAESNDIFFASPPAPAVLPTLISVSLFSQSSTE